MKYGNFYQMDIQKTSEKGRGVFAGEAIEAGKLIILEPIVMVPESDAIYSSVFSDNLFKTDAGMAVAWGIGCLLNHSENPNVKVNRLHEKGLLEYFSLCDIAVGEELIHTYARDIWFDVL